MDSIEDTAQISSLVKIADIYGPLNQARNEIRLLQWVSSPGDDDTVVHWRLFTVSLLEQPKYIAFSYVWGDASITENVTINGKTVPVTTSLAAALERVRKSVEIPDSSVFFWADALCINQKDALERNSQVQMMRSIYSKAMMVFSWLGLDEDPASTLYAIVFFMINVKERRSPQPVGVHPMQWMLKYPELWTVHEDSYGKNLFWAAVRKFFQNTYWTRVWILQEMALGKEVWLMGKTSSILLDDVLRFTDLALMFELSEVSRPDFVPLEIWSIISQKGYFVINTLLLVIQYRRHEVDPNRLLIGTALLLASDPRDKIFGLQALAPDATPPPDYTMSVRQIYCEVAPKLVSQGPMFLTVLLSYSGFGQDLYDDFQLPSWVPNWDFISKATRKHEIHTVAPSNSEWPSDMSISINRDLSENIHPLTTVTDFTVLRTYGCVCGTVVPQRLRHNFYSLGKVCGDYALQNSGLLYPNGDHPLKALLRVLTMDWKHVGRKEREKNDFDIEALYIHALYEIHLLDKIESKCSPKPNEEEIWRNNVELELRAILEQCGITSEKPFVAFLKLMFPVAMPDEAWDSYPARIARIGHLLDGRGVALEVRGPSCLFQTLEGYLGMAPPKCEVGDLVCVFSDCSIPVLLRREGNHYIHVGPCYVLGLMDGEAAQLVRNGKTRIEEFNIH